MTPKQDAWYRSVLNQFLQPGNSWNALRDLERTAARLGIPAETVIADAHVGGKKDRDREIRRGIQYHLAKLGPSRQGGAARTFQGGRPRPPTSTFDRHPSAVRDLIAAGESSGGEPSVLMGASPYQLGEDMSPDEKRAATVTWIRGLWGEGDAIFFTNKGAAVACLKTNIRTAGEWAETVESGIGLRFELAGLAAISDDGLARILRAGRAGTPTGVHMSDLAFSPFALLEIDELPFREQVKFWTGFIRNSRFAPQLVSLTWSGSRSIHGVIDTGARTPDERATEVERLRAWFCADPDERFCIDPQALGQLVKTRVPFLKRQDNDQEEQTLVYFNNCHNRQKEI